MPEKLGFDDEGSRLVEEFNASPQAQDRRRRITSALSLQPGQSLLDVGSGPGHQLFEMSATVGPSGQLVGVDPAESAIEISSRRCQGLTNVRFEQASLPTLPFDDASFDSVMSSQVFEYLDDVTGALHEIHRILRPAGRVLIHDTEWGALLWHAQDHDQMAKMMEVWNGHLVDPHLPQTLGARFKSAGFGNVTVEPVVHVESGLIPGSMSEVLMRFVVGYLESQGISPAETQDWQRDLTRLAEQGEYFFSSNEYIFTAEKPA